MDEMQNSDVYHGATDHRGGVAPVLRAMTIGAHVLFVLLLAVGTVRVLVTGGAHRWWVVVLAVAELSQLIPPLLASVREELGLSFDADAYARIVKEANDNVVVKTDSLFEEVRSIASDFITPKEKAGAQNAREQ